jgi:hypothetical protein
MKRFRLPEELKGEWIWRKSLLEKTDCYIFARKEFTLDSVGNEAILWISAVSSFHLFVNGRHLGFGPPPACRLRSYAEKYDISHCLEPGNNVIAILAHNSSAPMYSHYLRQAGLWCQLNINDEAKVWTDNRWRILDGTCYSTCQPRRAAGLEFMENVDLAAFPWGWAESGFNDHGWERPDHYVSINSESNKLQASPLEPNRCEETTPCSPVIKGSFEKTVESTHISFAGIFTGEKGVYAAQCYCFSKKEIEIPVKVNSDDAFSFFCNDYPVDSRGIPEMQPGVELQKTEGLLYLQRGNTPVNNNVSERIKLKSGWNRLLMVQQNGENSMGFSIIFPTLKAGSLKLLRHPETDSIPGWEIAGPLNMPLGIATGSLRLERISSSFYTPLEENINDSSCYLNNCRFTEVETGNLENSTGHLQTGEYLIFDLENIRYGFPVLNLEGSSGDIVDITYGDRLFNNRVASYNHSGRSTDTLNLREGRNEWIKYEARSARYIMISVRKATLPIKISLLNFLDFFRDYETGTGFECDDEVFNQIWKVSKATLNQTANFIFMDSPNLHRSQYLADAFIQALATFYSFGDFALSAKALKEFACAQFENGNMPAISSSGIYNSIPDYSLLWPVWLDTHSTLSADDDLRKKLLPNLDLLLDFFSTISSQNDGLLVDLGEKYNLDCFIDYGVTEKNGVLTALNALYCRTLLSSANIYQASMENGKASDCRKAAAKLAEQIRELTWNEEKGLFADACIDGKRVEAYSLQSNILALYSGIAKPEDFNRIFFHFFNKEAPFDKKANVHNNPYFKFFILETLFAFGKVDLALNYIKYYWGGMLEQNAGTWWNLFDPCLKKDKVPSTNFCHGYAVSPNIFLIRELAGIRPAEPGFLKIYFTPALSIVKKAKVALSTRYGRIKLEWTLDENNGLEVKVNSNYPLDIYPVLPEDIKEKCVFHLGNSISILEQS